VHLVQIIVLWLSVFDSAAWAQPNDQKPDKAFWPCEVRISEEAKVEQKTKYGVVTSKRTGASELLSSYGGKALRGDESGEACCGCLDRSKLFT
jgi:hypothetical protein